MIMPPRVASGLRRFLAAYKLQPMLVAVGTTAVPLGMAVIILGERASRAFSVLGGDIPAKMIGLALFTAGLLLMVGIFSNNFFLQAIGSSAGLVGFVLYGGGCYLGLGINGVIAGTLSLAVAAGFAGRIWLVTDLARRVSGSGK